MAQKLYGAQLKREFTREECQRKARMIVAMMLELMVSPSRDARLCQTILQPATKPMQTVAKVMRTLAEIREDEWNAALDEQKA